MTNKNQTNVRSKPESSQHRDSTRVRTKFNSI